MPLHRAYYSNPTDARAAAAAAVDRLSDSWRARTTTAGAEVASVSAVSTLRVESVEAIAPVGDGKARARVRVTAGDGRTEFTSMVAARTSLDSVLARASGIVSATTSAPLAIKPRSRVAKSVQVYVMGSATASLAGHVLQDPITHKLYTTATATVGPGAANIDVTETDSADTSEVTHGSPLEFIAPPSNVVPLARVIRMAGFTVPALSVLVHPSGRRYSNGLSSVMTDSGYALSGDHTVTTYSFARDTADGKPLDEYLTVGESLTFSTSLAGVASTATVGRAAYFPIPAGTILRGTFDPTLRYQTTEAAAIYDGMSADVPIVALGTGSAYNLDVVAVEFETPIAGVTAGAALVGFAPAGTYPATATPLVVGAPLEWSSRVYQTSDRRWVAEVFTLPIGS